VEAVGKLKGGPGIDVFEIDEPRPGPGEVIVEVRATAICGTDLHFYYWDDYARRHNPGFPKVLGHEFSGVVVEVGEGVKGLDIGDRVAAETHIPCGSCYYCRTGRPHICENVKLYGIDTTYGSFTKYTILPERVAIKVPEEISFEEAALLEPFGVAMHAVSEAGIKPGDTVAVLGCGPIGLFIQQLAKISGASKVIATEVSKYRLNLASKVGAADEVVDALREDPVKRVYELTGRGVDVVFEASGSTKAMRQGLEMVSKSGRVVQVGIARKPTEININTIVEKEVRLVGIAGRLMFSTWYRSIGTVQSRAIDVLQVVTHRLPLRQAPKAFETLSKGEAGKVLLIP